MNGVYSVEICLYELLIPFHPLCISDEEYRRIIAGGDDSEEEEEAARAAFQLADVDGSGNISLTEFLALSRERAAEEQRGHEAAPSIALESRLVKLEQNVKANSEKLDRILALLQSKH